MNVEIIDKINELRKLGVSTSGLPDQWRREVCDLIAGEVTSADKVSKLTGINILTIESWIRKYKAKRAASSFKEAKVVGPETLKSPAVFVPEDNFSKALYKIEIKTGPWVTTLQSTDKRELIRYLELA